jgi:hypothetical protein
MHVLIIFILILGLVLARINSPRLNEGLTGDIGSTGDTGQTGDTGSDGPIGPVAFVQPPLYSGVW